VFFYSAVEASFGDQLMTVTALKDQIGNLQKFVAEKDRIILDRDKMVGILRNNFPHHFSRFQLAALNARLHEQESVHKRKQAELEKMHTEQHALLKVWLG
jgi:hypothetical protein